MTFFLSLKIPFTCEEPLQGQIRPNLFESFDLAEPERKVLSSALILALSCCPALANCSFIRAEANLDVLFFQVACRNDQVDLNAKIVQDTCVSICLDQGPEVMYLEPTAPIRGYSDDLHKPARSFGFTLAEDIVLCERILQSGCVNYKLTLMFFENEVVSRVPLLVDRTGGAAMMRFIWHIGEPLANAVKRHGANPDPLDYEWLLDFREQPTAPFTEEEDLAILHLVTTYSLPELRPLEPWWNYIFSSKHAEWCQQLSNRTPAACYRRYWCSLMLRLEISVADSKRLHIPLNISWVHKLPRRSSNLPTTFDDDVQLCELLLANDRAVVALSKMSITNLVRDTDLANIPLNTLYEHYDQRIRGPLARMAWTGARHLDWMWLLDMHGVGLDHPRVPKLRSRYSKSQDAHDSGDEYHEHRMH